MSLSGCRFEPRCPQAFEACRAQEPPLLSLAPGHAAACLKPLAAAR
jgi:peptide/nickel transport system ATP-binding protein